MKLSERLAQAWDAFWLDDLPELELPDDPDSPCSWWAQSRQLGLARQHGLPVRQKSLAEITGAVIEPGSIQDKILQMKTQDGN